MGIIRKLSILVAGLTVVGCGAAPQARSAPGDDCTSEPLTPPLLFDRTSPGEPTGTEEADGTIFVTWGDPDTTASVTQILGDPGEDFPLSVDSDQHVEVGAYEADVVPVGDDAIGEIRIEIVDPQDCLRAYNIGPGIDLVDATIFAEAWLEELTGTATPTTTAATPTTTTAATIPQSR